jgi:hypothetical protein
MGTPASLHCADAETTVTIGRQLLGSSRDGEGANAFDR